MRKLIYLAIGILTGLIIFVFMLINVPSIERFESQSSGFLTVRDDGGTDLRSIKGVTSSFLEYGSYRLESRDFDNYKKQETVKFGKVNPMFYFKNVEKVVEAAEDSKEPEKAAPAERASSAPTPSITLSPEKDTSGNSGGTASQIVPEYEVNPEDMSTGFKDIGDQEKITKLEGFNVVTSKFEEVDATAALVNFKKDGILPLESKFYNLTSNFGKREDPFSKSTAIHTGIDIANPGIDGSNVYSVSKGKVKSIVKGDKGYGNHVVVSHDGYDTLYAHMSAISNIKVGSEVVPGSLLGLVGSTGRSTAPHLHFEVRVNDVALDPTKFLKEIREVE